MAGKGGRIFFLDEMRALALIGMIIYHAAYDLYALFGLDFNFYSPGWDTLQMAVCCTFIVIAGISSRLTKNALKHGFVVFDCGMLMTVGTYFFMPDQAIWFGVLHFLGASMMIYYLFRKSVNKTNASVRWFPLRFSSVFMGFLPEVSSSAMFLFRMNFISANISE